MGHVVGVKFREQGRVYYFDSRPYVVKMGDEVIVKTEAGLGLGHVVVQRTNVPDDVAGEPLVPIFRLATDEDLKEQAANTKLAQEAFAYCRDCISSHKLEMKLVDVEVYFDRSKMVFYFTAPDRIDFRELVKVLVRAYRTRIELRQIGVRHETQMLGAVGNCGQVCCCQRFLRKFEPVTIKMAKDQNLFLNPAKISGVCGRLLCCLAYEKDTYGDFQKRVPRMGKKFTTSLGHVKILRSNLFRDSVTVLTEDRQEREFSLDEWGEIVSGKPVHDAGTKESPASAKNADPRPVKEDVASPQKKAVAETGAKKLRKKSYPSHPETQTGKKQRGHQARKQESEGKPHGPKHAKKGAGKKHKSSYKKYARKQSSHKKGSKK